MENNIIGESYLNQQIDEFEKLTTYPQFVDKSDFISFVNQRINVGGNSVCVARARRFGKTLTTSMLNQYYSRGFDSKKLFSKLKLSQMPNWDQHLNKYDTLLLNASNLLNSMRRNGETSLAKFISNKVFEELINIYPNYVHQSDYNDLYLVLNSIYNKTKIKFAIIIDEWDAPFRMDQKNVSMQEEYLSFLEDLFKSNQSKKYLFLGYMTGILPIKQYSNTHSKLNDFDEYTMVDPGKTASYIGFTESEVKQLCSKFNKSFNGMKLWYDGYSFLDARSIYNPNSVIKALDDTDNLFTSYWGKLAVMNL